MMLPYEMRLSLLAVLGIVACTGTTQPEGHSTPADAKIVTTDVAAFWNAFALIRSVSDTAPLRAYIDNGSVGLKDFTDLRWKSSTILTQSVWILRDYYASIRETSLAAAQMEPQIRAAFAVADTLIDDPIFPDVYFAIGAMGTGGTTSDHGLLIEAMDGSDYSKWLYNGGDVTASSTRPADLGYFIGARIVESYYRRATDKHAAIQDILRIRDFHVFLAASGYTGQP